MDTVKEYIELVGVIVVSLATKWLLDSEPIADDESRNERMARRKKTFGGMFAGVLCAWYGPGLLIYWSQESGSIVEGIFTEDLRIAMTIFMAFSGEHIVRAILTKLPNWIEMVVNRKVSKS